MEVYPKLNERSLVHVILAIGLARVLDSMRNVSMINSEDMG